MDSVALLAYNSKGTFMLCARNESKVKRKKKKQLKKTLKSVETSCFHLISQKTHIFYIYSGNNTDM